MHRKVYLNTSFCCDRFILGTLILNRFYLNRGKLGKADQRGKVNHPPFCSFEWCYLISEIAISTERKKSTFVKKCDTPTPFSGSLIPYSGFTVHNPGRWRPYLVSKVTWHGSHESLKRVSNTYMVSDTKIWDYMPGSHNLPWLLWPLTSLSKGSFSSDFRSSTPALAPRNPLPGCHVSLCTVVLRVWHPIVFYAVFAFPCFANLGCQTP